MAATTTTGYCMKCKAQREIKDARQITMKNGRPATEGICAVCGTRMFKIGAAQVGRGRSSQGGRRSSLTG